MRHFVGYHNADKGGELGWTSDQNEFKFWSRKPISLLQQAEGNRVWAIDGITEGRKKIYRLWGYYVAKRLQNLGGGRFNVLGENANAFIFDDPIELNEFAWFPELKLRQGNFGFGVNETKDEIAIAGLMQIEKEQSRKSQATETQKSRSNAQSKRSTRVRELFPEEFDFDAEKIYEGDISFIGVNFYERSARARKRCIEHYGLNCSVCDLNFKQAYGDVAEGIIHVYHIKRLSEIKERYRVNPVKDLRPVCPNCHAVIHSSYPMFTIEEVQKMLRRNNGVSDK